MAHLFPTSNPSLDEIQSEIIFKDVQLQTLDKKSDTYAEDKQHLEKELDLLSHLFEERNLSASRASASLAARDSDMSREGGVYSPRAGFATAPSSLSPLQNRTHIASSVSAMQNSPQMYSSIPPGYAPASGLPIASTNSPNNGHLSSTQEQPVPRRSSATSSATMGSMPSPPEFSTYSSPLNDFQNTRKRARPESLSMHGDRNGGAAYKQPYRPTPSPSETAVSTPVTAESIDMTEQPQPSMLADYASRYRDLRQQQIQQQAAAEEVARQRRLQEEEDERFARALSQQNGSLPQRQPSRNHVQTTFNPRDLSIRAVPNPSIKREPQSISSGSRPTFGQPSVPSTHNYSQPGQQPAHSYSHYSQYSTPNSFIGYRPANMSQPQIPGAWPNSADIASPQAVPSVSLNAANGAEFDPLDDDDDSDIVEISPDTYSQSAAHRPQSAPLRTNFTNGTFAPMQTYNVDPFGDLDQYLGGHGTGASSDQYLQLPQNGVSNAPYGLGPAGTPVHASPFGQFVQNVRGAIDGLTSSLGYAGQLLERPVPGRAVGGFTDSMSVLREIINGPNAPINNLVANHAPTPWASQGIGAGFTAAGNRLNPYSIDDDDEEDVYRSRYDYLLADPSKNKEDLDNLLANIRPDEDLPPHLREGTPEALKMPLMEHQKLGLSWLKNMEQGSNKGGILADDMGLGKTIQALALMVSRPSEDPRRKTTLIVAPVALLKQWKDEIIDKLKTSHRLTVHIHHSGAKKSRFTDLQRYDVVLTTYGCLGQEFRRREEWDKKVQANPSAVQTEKDKMSLIGPDCRWYRVILDEAQCIKNKGTLAAKGSYCLNSIFRLCMTGTPMMNNVEELFSLVHFLRIRPYNEFSKFKQEFVNPLKSNVQYQRNKGMKALQTLLKAILLRRTKTSKIDGKPLLSLPDRINRPSNVEFDNDQMELYKALETSQRLQFNRYLKAGTVGNNYSSILLLLLRLRQACCHPHLITDLSQDVPGSEDAKKAVAKALDDVIIDRIKNADLPFECPVCMDPTENPAIFECGHDVCSECFVILSNPQAAIAQGDDNGKVRCPECRAEVRPEKITDYKTFKMCHMPEALTAEEREDADAFASDSDDDSDSDSDSDADDVDDRGNLRNFIVNDDDEGEDEQGGEENGESKLESKKKGKGKAKAKTKKSNKHKVMTLAELKKEGMKNKAAKRTYLKRLRRDWVSSAKIDQVLTLLRQIHDNDPTEKTLIFSQFTSFLDLLEVPIDREGIGYERYDGSMSASARSEAIEHFKNRPDCKVMLVSLKAGNAGLNLTVASQVIIMDPFWNPFIEEQAIDRAHRIGQRRNVQIHKILVAGTVEDRIIQLQEKKREIVNTALDENEAKKIGRLGVRELAYLFGVTGNPNQDPTRM